MSTPVITNIPLIANRGCDPVQVDDSGFPFDDHDFDREGSHSFRSQLDDIAKRHPEFAKHLNLGETFPFRSHTLGRHRRGSETENPSSSQEPEFRRYTDRPFGSRFEQFGFPFTRHFNDEPDFHYTESTSPQQHYQTPQSNEKQSSKEPSSPQHTEKPPLTPQSQERVRKNLQQSNTVDLGQKQDIVDENRSQRSMSAPPENRSTGRFVSSINIPIQRPIDSDMGAQSSQYHQTENQNQSQSRVQNKPTERVIPIHVEGRDEPIVPKATFSTPQSAAHRPQADKIFGRSPNQFTQFINKSEPHGHASEDKQQQQYQKQQHSQQQHQPHQQQELRQQQEPHLQQQQQQSHQQQEENFEPSQEIQQEPQQKPSRLSQIDQIQIIQKDVSELMGKVQDFNGKFKDKEYLYLDEMLTRNLIKLDNIETEGKDNIRQARKEAIKCIEECIGILEAKANANTAAITSIEHIDEKMETEKLKEPESVQVTTESQLAGNNDVVVKDTEINALEVSGLQRSGAVVNPEPTAMEIVSTENVTKEEQQEELKEAVQTSFLSEEVANDQTTDVKLDPNQLDPSQTEVKTESMEISSQVTDVEENMKDKKEEKLEKKEENLEEKSESKKEEKKERKKGKKKEKIEKK